MIQELHPLLYEHTTAHIMGLFPFLISLLSKSHMLCKGLDDCCSQIIHLVFILFIAFLIMLSCVIQQRQPTERDTHRENKMKPYFI